MRPARGHRGFTLLEALVALTILAGGLLGVLSGLRTAAAALTGSVRRSEATDLAEARLERALVDPAGPTAGTGRTGPYDWQVQVETVAEGLQRVSVTVRWFNRGVPEQVTLAEIVGPSGPREAAS